MEDREAELQTKAAKTCDWGRLGVGWVMRNLGGTAPPKSESRIGALAGVAGGSLPALRMSWKGEPVRQGAQQQAGQGKEDSAGGPAHGKAAVDEGCPLTVLKVTAELGPFGWAARGTEELGRPWASNRQIGDALKETSGMEGRGGFGGNQEGRWRGWVAFVSWQAARHRQAFTVGSPSETPSPHPSSITKHLPEALKQHVWERACLGSRTTSRSGRT